MLYFSLCRRDIKGHKLILWLGGGFQNQPYQTQVDRIHSLGNSMTGKIMLPKARLSSKLMYGLH